MKKPDLTKYKTTSTLYLHILIIAAGALVFGWQCTSYSLSNHSADLHIGVRIDAMLGQIVAQQVIMHGIVEGHGELHALP